MTDYPINSSNNVFLKISIPIIIDPTKLIEIIPSFFVVFCSYHRYLCIGCTLMYFIWVAFSQQNNLTILQMSSQFQLGTSISPYALLESVVKWSSDTLTKIKSRVWGPPSETTGRERKRGAQDWIIYQCHSSPCFTSVAALSDGDSLAEVLLCEKISSQPRLILFSYL